MTKIHLNLDCYSGDVKKRLEYITPSSLETFFSDDFIQAHTNHKTFAEFCKAIGCDFFTDKDKLSDGNFDSAIKAHSKFSSWVDMLNTACQTLVDEK